jgi:hypothetical protein
MPRCPYSPTWCTQDLNSCNGQCKTNQTRRKAQKQSSRVDQQIKLILMILLIGIKIGLILYYSLT